MTTLYSLDIETACNIADCPHFGHLCPEGHSLIPHQARITCVGIWSPTSQVVFRDLKSVEAYLALRPDYELVGHNFKFDLKHMAFHGLDIPADRWAHDTQIMAHISLSKVPEDYLAWYGQARLFHNKKLPKGFKHRNAGPLSLKMLAPYFLKIQPFWETPDDHNNDQYVLKDAEYTYRLCQFFLDQLEKEKLLSFYQDRAMNWARMLLKMEKRGVALDLPLLATKKAEAEKRTIEVKSKLDEVWAPAYETFRNEQVYELHGTYLDKCGTALAKLKINTIEKTAAVSRRYLAMSERACAKIPHGMNLDSPAQVKWLLKDYLKLDVTGFHDEESTGKEVLQKLAAQGREDIKLFLEYRKQRKLVTSFFPTYESLQHKGVLHCSFNMTGTKTGRLSSSDPNLQQVPGHLHSLFIARPGYKIITRDESYVEPRLIAYYTEDPILCDLIKRDGDFHSRNAIIMFGLTCAEKDVKKLHPKERNLAKTVGLALLYGAGPNRIHQTATQQGFNWKYQHCKQIYSNFKEEYRTVFEVKEQIDRAALSEPITTYLGRKRRFEDPSEIHMQAFNGLVQGSASEMVVDSAYQSTLMFKDMGIDAHPLLLVHDEQVWEAPDQYVEQAEAVIDMNMTEYKMPTAMGNIPLKVEGKVSDRWEK